MSGRLCAQMHEVLSYCICGTAVPVGALKGLFRSQDFNKAAAERVKDIGVGNVIVQGGGVELGQNIYLPEA